MGKNYTQNLSRRSFLRRGAAASGALLTAGAFGSLGATLLGIGSREAVALTMQEAREEAGPLGERPVANSLETISRDGVLARLGILSDSHIAASDNTAHDKLAVALETMAWTTPDIDAFFMIGDVSCEGLDEDFAAFATLVTERLSALYASSATVPTMHLLMGNHDFLNSTQEHFQSFFAQRTPASLLAAMQNEIALLPGVTVIKLNGAGSAEVDKIDYTISYDFLATALEEAAANRPNDALLVMAHEPPEYMSLPLSHECGYFGQGSSLDMIDLLAHYPQARLFCGHLHNPLDLPETINTELGFTTVYTSTVGSCFFVRNTLVDSDQVGSQGLVLDVMEDGSLLLHRLDFTEQKYFGEPVLI